MIRAEDVTPAALKETHIDEVLQMIGIQEEVVSEDITLRNITGLLNLYQKAIEHYSAFSSHESHFQDFMNRQKQFLSREDIQTVMNSIGDQDPEIAQAPYDAKPRDVFIEDSDEEEKNDNMLVDDPLDDGFRIDSADSEEEGKEEEKVEVEVEIKNPEINGDDIAALNGEEESLPEKDPLVQKDEEQEEEEEQLDGDESKVKDNNN